MMASECREFERIADLAIRKWHAGEKSACYDEVAELVRRIQQEERCVESLVRVVYECRWAHAIKGFEHLDREDLASRVYEKLTLERILKFNGESSFRTWLYMVVRHTALDLNRSEGRQPEPGLAHHQEQIDGSHSSFAASEIDAVAKLNDDELLLYKTWQKYGFGRSAPHVAKELNLGQRTVRNRLKRLTKKMSAEMADPDRDYR